MALGGRGTPSYADSWPCGRGGALRASERAPSPRGADPVNELGEDLRRDLRGAVHESLRLLLSAFFGACDARAGELERKRAKEDSPGQQHSFLFVLLCSRLGSPSHSV